MPLDAGSTSTSIHHIGGKAGQTATVEGWLYNRRSSGKIQFLIVRDGTGYLQCVVPKAEVSAEVWAEAEKATQESSLRVSGAVRAEPRAPGGYEMSVEKVELLGGSEGYPITPKEHGVDFLMNLRHLWMRSSQQHAVLRVRSEVEQAIRDFFYEREFTLIDSPILTGSSVEGTSTLFETDYFGDKAYLSQSGQLYLEPAAAAFGKVYCFGPTFRAEKSKTRRHLTEFWMIEPEVAFMEFEGLVELAEDFVVALTGRVLERCQEDLKRLERDTAKLEAIRKPFPRITYREGIAKLAAAGFPVKFGDDLGADEETALAQGLDRPLVVSRFPTAIKSFYMQPDPQDPEVVLGLDMLAPEGYGEIIGGSQRIHDLALLERRLEEHGLPREAYEWYLDVRRYGTFPHSGFGMGLERFVTWMCGIHHLREAIPYPRTLKRIYP
jgi:asparaginyl-tRNA synthetase